MLWLRCWNRDKSTPLRMVRIPSAGKPTSAAIRAASIEDTDSNFASLFTIWDRLHGTLRLDRAQESLTIGPPL